jgi:branched-chain amino acid transport system ATP-binding protein
VIGPNGAGKTTLFNVICGFVRPQLGHLEIDGRRMAQPRPDQLKGLGIARTLQGVGLWHGLTVLENVMEGVHPEAGFLSSLLAIPRADRSERRARQAAMEAIESLGIGNYADHLATTLPYAIAKRASIARAIVSRPRLLLLDEPASGLSDAEMSEMAELIRRLRLTMGVMLVEHHMDLVMSVCDRIVVLDFGAVIASGTPAEVRDDPRVTAAYLGHAVSSAGGGPG